MYSNKILIIHLFCLITMMNGYCQKSTITKIDSEKVHYYSVDKIYPNPNSNPYNIFTNFSIPESCLVEIKIVNKAEEIVYQFENQWLSPGSYQLNWLSKDSYIFPPKSGINFLQMNFFEDTSSIFPSFSTNLKFLNLALRGPWIEYFKFEISPNIHTKIVLNKLQSDLKYTLFDNILSSNYRVIFYSQSIDNKLFKVKSENDILIPLPIINPGKYNFQFISDDTTYIEDFVYLK